MAGIRISIPTKFSNSSLPILRVDDILPAAGALLLLDATHGSDPWAGGTKQGMVLPNIAASQATDLTGNALNAELTVAGSVVLERSEKGGLHAMPPSTTGLTINNYARLNLPDAVKQYLFSNHGHSFYFSQWTRTTRKAVGTSTPPFSLNFNNDGGSGYQVRLYRNGSKAGTYPSNTVESARMLGNRETHDAIGLPVLHNVAVKSWGGSAPSATHQIDAVPFMSGVSSWTLPGSGMQHPAVILYRAYIEDLTVSGRTYAEVDFADHSLFTRHLLSPGGRYYGDRYTEPSN